MTTWRLDRSDPLNSLPEFYETEEAAERRAWALIHIAGLKCKLIVWEDVAAYYPPETREVAPQRANRCSVDPSYTDGISGAQNGAQRIGDVA